MLPNMLRRRLYGALVCIPDGHLIIIGGFNAEVNAAIDSVECLSLTKLQRGWRNIAPLPYPICASGAVYFHDVVLRAGGQHADRRILSAVYALKPPMLPLAKEEDGHSGNTNDLGQWTLLSAELPSPVWANCMCRIGNEIFIFGKWVGKYLSSL